MIFKVENNPYESGTPLYQCSEVDIKPGVTVLVGCNGSGKSTLIGQIHDQLNCKKIEHVMYDNVIDGGSNSMSEALYRDKGDLLFTLAASSEGERIYVNMGTFAGEIGNLSKYCRLKNQKQMFILMDAVDSGLSLDNIQDLKKDLFKTVFTYNKDLEVYIICCANDYAVASGENCMDVYTGQYVHFDSYLEYFEFVMESRRIKDKRDGN